MNNILKLPLSQVLSMRYAVGRRCQKRANPGRQTISPGRHDGGRLAKSRKPFLPAPETGGALQSATGSRPGYLSPRARNDTELRRCPGTKYGPKFRSICSRNLNANYGSENSIQPVDHSTALAIPGPPQLLVCRQGRLATAASSA